jgi:hypothetical protein
MSSGTRRLAVLLAVAGTAAMAACAGGSANPTALRSGLVGVVTRGPITPVCQVGKPCSEPASATLIFERGGRERARTRSDAQGRYRVTLAPGTYSVRMPGKIGIGRGLEPRTVKVPRGRYARVNFSIDTGIR